MEDRDQGLAPNLLEPSTTTPTITTTDEDEEDDEFTFAVPAASPLAAADDTFSDGRIRPVYPIFGRPPSPPEAETETATARVPLRRLLLEERSSSVRSSEEYGGDELDGVPPDTYCVWAPGSSAPASPARCRKSGSTGSVLRWRRINERLVGRSHSDGKEKFVFLNPNSNASATGKEKGNKGSVNEADAGAAGHHRIYYGKGGKGGGNGGRKSYLPYKQELVGLFANVSALRRSYHPF